MPDGLAYLAALVVAAMFAASSVAKWRDPAGAARGLGLLGVPRPWAVVRILPPLEAAVALALVVVPPVGGTAAVVLLVGFTAFLVDRLRAGIRAPCACFGGGGGPLSVADPVRNVLLSAASLLAVTASRTRPDAAAVAVAAVAAGASVLVVRALRAATVER